MATVGRAVDQTATSRAAQGVGAGRPWEVLRGAQGCTQGSAEDAAQSPSSPGPQAARQALERHPEASEAKAREGGLQCPVLADHPWGAGTTVAVWQENSGWGRACPLCPHGHSLGCWPWGRGSLPLHSQNIPTSPDGGHQRSMPLRHGRSVALLCAGTQEAGTQAPTAWAWAGRGRLWAGSGQTGWGGPGAAVASWTLRGVTPLQQDTHDSDWSCQMGCAKWCVSGMCVHV